VVVSLSLQALWAYEDGKVVRSTYVSTGMAGTPTPAGLFWVINKLPVQTMEGTISGQAYRVEDVPNVMYFNDDGDALHGTYWHANFGVPMSHGCVNLPLDVAAWMYDWAPMGMPVQILP
jgi:lipoprotein-anchoring transpeptidase ErfK/SrfK